MATPQDGPTLANIELPPGFTLGQFLSYQRTQVTISINAAIAFGIIIWDYAYLLPQELRYYQTMDMSHWKTPTPWSFAIVRGMGVASLIAVFCISCLQTDHCEAGLIVSQVTSIIVTAASGIILGYRALKLWDMTDRYVWVLRSVIKLLYLVVLGLWITVATQYRAVEGIPVPVGSNCQLFAFPPWSFVSHLSSAMFEITVIAVMLLKLSQQRMEQNPRVFAAYRGSAVYVAIIATTSLITAIMQILPKQYQTAKRIILPYHTVITATMAARVFFGYHFVYNLPSLKTTVPTTGNDIGIWNTPKMNTSGLVQTRLNGSRFSLDSMKERPKNDLSHVQIDSLTAKEQPLASTPPSAASPLSPVLFRGSDLPLVSLTSPKSPEKPFRPLPKTPAIPAFLANEESSANSSPRQTERPLRPMYSHEQIRYASPVTGVRKGILKNNSNPELPKMATKTMEKSRWLAKAALQKPHEGVDVAKSQWI